MKRATRPPGPKGYFLIGNAVQMLRDPFYFPIRCAREYGDVVYLRFGPFAYYMLSNPSAIDQVLRVQHRNFPKDWGTRLLSSFLGQGLVTSDGELWRRQRQLAQPAFRHEQIQRYGQVMVEHTEQLIRGWRPGQTRDVHADLMQLTLGIVAQTLFSAQVSGKAAVVGRAMEAIMKYFAGFLAMFPRLLWLPTRTNRRYRQAVRDLDQVIYDTIADRRTGRSEGDDLLSRLLAARDEDNSSMTDRQLRDELVTLMVAGHETTAVALSYCLYLLAQHPQAAEQLGAELDEVLDGRLPTAADAPRLRYTEWVVREAMRLYPPVTGISRQAAEECVIDGWHVPKGALIAMLQLVVHRDPRWFEQPEEFRPERWDNDLARRLPRGAYFPFGDGPRVCIGSQFAMMEAVLILATIAQRFRLELAPDFSLELLPSVTLRPKRGIKMVVRERTQRVRAEIPTGSSPSYESALHES
jgi:cytochrome P450